ncbi:Hypothetical protein FSTVST1_281 [Faustovirus ST1]|nr:Hypothetical protein FSTVST1_281 [Faustovirus ST1]
MNSDTINSAVAACEIEELDFTAEYSKVIKELEEYYGFDDDYDPNVDTSEVNEVDQFKTKIKYIQDNDFNYVAINCSYTTRLNCNPIAKFATTVGAKLVGVGGYIGSGIIYSTSGEPVAQYGEVLFKCNKVSIAFKLVNHLMSYYHCGCFYWNTLYEVKTRTEGKHNIIVLNFDTESG